MTHKTMNTTQFADYWNERYIKWLQEEYKDCHEKISSTGVPYSREPREERKGITNKRAIAFLEDYIMKCKHYYYNTDMPLVDDWTYDMLEVKLYILDPDNKVLQQVGFDPDKKLHNKI